MQNPQKLRGRGGSLCTGNLDDGDETAVACEVRKVDHGEVWGRYPTSGPAAGRCHLGLLCGCLLGRRGGGGAWCAAALWGRAGEVASRQWPRSLSLSLSMARSLASMAWIWLFTLTTVFCSFFTTPRLEPCLLVVRSSVGTLLAHFAASVFENSSLPCRQSRAYSACCLVS